MSVGACRTERATPRPSTLVIATGADADLFFPPLVLTLLGQQVVDLVFERLAVPDSTLNTLGDRGFRPQLASHWTWATDSLSIAFTLDPKARWHDSHPVTASDVRFSFALYADSFVASPIASTLTNIDSVTVRDSHTAVVWFHRRRPEQFYEAVYFVRVLPEHRLAAIARTALRTDPFGRAPVGSGPYRFVRWQAGQVVELLADTASARVRPKVSRILWTITPDPAAAVTRVLVGEADFVETLRPADVARLASHPDVEVIRWPSLTNGVLLFNLRDPNGGAGTHPVLASRDVRRAIAMAIDRERLVTSVFDSSARASGGPLPPPLLVGVPTSAGPAFDLAHANSLLDSAGWSLDAKTGIRQKAGRRLRLRLTVPPSSSTRMRLAVLIQDMLLHAGIAIDIESVEMSAMLATLAKRRFDLTLDAMGWDPSPALARQLWTSQSAHATESENYSGYASVAFDGLLDSAAQAATPTMARGYYGRAWSVLMTDLPALPLYDLRNAGAIRRTVSPGAMAPQGWWLDLPAWRVAPSVRGQSSGPSHPTADRDVAVSR